LAFAYEAVARAASVREDWNAVSSSLLEARAFAEKVVVPKNRKLLLDDLATIQTTA
jgi:hypothetical protein